MNSIIWLVASILLFILEALTTTLVCIWFAIGAISAFIVSLFGANMWWCLSVFVLVSIISLVFTRKYALSKFNKSPVATNADSLIGKPAIVTEEIDSVKSVGSVLINGQDWSATTRVGHSIKKGELVEVVAISGVKLVVVPSDNPLSTLSRTACYSEESKLEN